MENKQNLIFKILRSTVCEEDFPHEEKSLDKNSIVQVYKMAKAHDLAHILKTFYDKQTFDGNINLDILEQAEIMAVCRYERNKQTVEFLKDVFEKAKIPFVLLKGSVIRDYYPEPWMRTSCDIDILVQESDLKRAIDLLVCEYGYSWDGKKNYHDVSLYSESKVHIELHHSIKENKPLLDKVLEKAWDYTTPKNDGVERVFSNEFFLFHQVAHTAYHFTAGGCGIRSVLDIWIIRKKMALQIDEEVFNKMLETASLALFYKALVHLSEVWFSGETATELSENMQKYIMQGGVYGTLTNGMKVKRAKKKNRVKYFFTRLFLPYSLMKIRYPAIAKFPPLLPIFYLIRPFGLLNPKTAKRAVNETKANLSTTDETVEQTVEMLKELGI